MKVGILVTGDPPAGLADRFGDYAAMFGALAAGGEARAWRVHDDEWPEGPEAADAWLITGSPAGVYDDLPWIGRLKRFVLDASAAGRRLVGICFGHQIMAEAFGGRVEKAACGWGIGRHRYDIVARADWMTDDASIAVAVSHQDQVVALPPGARVLAASAFTPFAVLDYPERGAISFQCHPEFPAGFAEALIESRRARLPDPDGAIATLAGTDDSARVRGWIRAFLAGER